MSEEKDQKEEGETEAAEAAPPSAEELVVALQDKLLRTQAEIENNRKRFERELDRVRTVAVEGFAKDLLQVLDDMRRAQASWEKQELNASVQQGLALILSSANQMLERHAIKEVKALGEPFDPNFHEALLEDTESEAETGTITQVIEVGYMLGDRLLRPARVAVRAKKTPAPPDETPKNP